MPGDASSVETIDVNTAFYDVMFGPSATGNEALNNLEQTIYTDLKKKLEDSDHISTSIPVLPEVAVELISYLLEDNADFDSVCAIANRDPSIAGSIIKVANTPLFRRTKMPITSIEQAAGSLGLSGIGAIAWTAMVNESLQISHVYYQLFGRLIWQHSQEVALACKQHAGKHNPLLCYMLGLMHDTGKIIIFNKICKAFKASLATEKPGGRMFRLLMTEYSLCLSSLVAREWGLDDRIVRALEEQSQPPRSELGQLLYQVNLCGEIKLLEQSQYINADEARILLADKGIPQAVITYFWQTLPSQ